MSATHQHLAHLEYKTTGLLSAEEPAERVETEAQEREDFLPSVYQELRKLAAARMAGERETSTLQSTALVHEAWVRLAGSGECAWENQAHFFVAAAEAMRRILIDRARRKRALKRGARPMRIDLAQVDVAIEANKESSLAINEALEKLAVAHPQAAELVKLRFFAGLGYTQAAESLGISERSAKRS